MCRHSASPASSTPISDAITPPNGIPQYITATALLRERGSTDSDDKAIRFGIAPPRPRPVSARTATSIAKPDTCAVAIDSSPNRHTDAISTCLRPMRSASQPPSIAPGSRPNVPALNASPICETDNPNSWAMRGAATPTDCRSSPSSNAIAKHRPSVVATAGLAATEVSMSSPNRAACRKAAAASLLVMVVGPR
jgi:hypothetical protein